MIRRAILCALALLTLSLTGCHEQRPDAAPVPPPPPAAMPAPPPTPAPAAVATPAPIQPGCAAHLITGPAQQLSIGKLAAVAQGSHLRFGEKTPSGGITFGVLGPINEPSGANLLGLERYLRFFHEHHVDAVLVTGDSGETPAGIDQVLEPLGASGLPVFVVIGNSECAQDYVEGVHRAQQRYSNIVDLNQYREVSFPEATLVSLPGHHDPNFLHCAEGCRYDSSTVDEVIAAAKEAPSPVVLVSHGPPKGESSQALDFAPDHGGNVGNPDIRRALADGNIRFGVFSNIKEAGARATDATGTTVIPQDSLSSSLFLNPGPAATDDWPMNDGSTSHGFAAVLQISPKGGRWWLYRNKPLTAAERKKAEALEKREQADQPDDD